MFGRILFGAAIGGALVYFFDPRSGAERRARLQARWQQNREPVLRTASKAATAAQESASQLGDQASARVTELREKVQKPRSESATQYDTESAGTAGMLEDTETRDLPERMRTYEAQEAGPTESGDLPTPR